MYKDTVILAGSGRSGTTWLGNIIAANPIFRVVFEPFDWRHVPEAKGMPLRAYGRPGAVSSWAPFVRQVLAGRIDNDWISREGYRWWAYKQLIKEVRANLLLAWLDHAFDVSIIYMTRHPCAVTLSRMKLGWETHLDVFLDQPELVEDYLHPYLDLIHSAETEAQKHAAMWCIENLVPLRQMPFHRWAFCTYEQLYIDTEAEVERVFNALGLRQTWFTRRAMEEVSSVTRPDSPLRDNRNPLTDWQSSMPEQDRKEVLAMVAAFGIRLYNHHAMPDLDTLVDAPPGDVSA